MLFGSTALPTGVFEQYRKVYLLHFFVRGFQFYDGPEIINSINANGLVDLVREPDNEHDSCAIAIYFEGVKIGYVPAEDNEVLSRILDAGLLDLQAEITRIEPLAETWEQISVAIYALKKDEGGLSGELTKATPLNYYTIKDGEQYYKRIYYDDREMIDGETFYEMLVNNSSSDEIFDVIHNSFPDAEELDDVVNNSRFVINRNRQRDKILSTVSDFESSVDGLFETINDNIVQIDNVFDEDGYVVANVEKIASIPDRIEKFVKVVDKTGNIFYEVELK